MTATEMTKFERKILMEKSYASFFHIVEYDAFPNHIIGNVWKYYAVSNFT